MNGVTGGISSGVRGVVATQKTSLFSRGESLVGVIAIAWLSCVLTGCASLPDIRGQSPMLDDADSGKPTKRPARRIDDEPLPDEERVPDRSDEGLPLSDEDPDALTDPIAEIVIEGNDTIETTAIRKLVRSAVGRPPAEQQIREDVRALYSTRWFFSVEPRYRRNESGLVLVFRVIERPMVEQIEYRGNKRVNTEFLQKLTGLRVGSPYDVSVNREAARRITEHYQEKGFPYAKVELQQGNRREERQVVFEITEGPKVIVGSVRFKGNDSFAGSLLKTKVSMKPSFLGLPFLGKYKPERVPDDIAAIKQYYHSLGYFDVKIEKEIDIDESPWNPISYGTAHAIITYNITEGPRFQIRNLLIEGNKVFSTDELAAELKLRSLDPYNARLMNKDIETIKDRYGKLGRTFANVNPVPRFLEEPGTMDLVYQVNEDRVYTIRHIDVSILGDYPHTKESVVLNRILVHPGDLADPKMIERSRRRLEGQLFERVGPQAPRVQLSKVEEKTSPNRSRIMQAGGTIRGQNPDDIAAIAPVLMGQVDPLTNPLGGGATDPLLFEPPPGQLDLNLSATETQTGRLSFGVGVNSNSGVVGSIILEENNFDLFRLPGSFDDIRNGTAFRGGGQQFRIEAVPGNIVSRYLMSWTDPYFLDSNYSVGVSGFFFNRFYRDWQEDRLGGRVTVGKQLTQMFSLIGTVRLETVDVTRPAVPTPALLTAALGESFLSTGRIMAAYDTRDSQFLPADGHYLTAGFEHAFGDFNYPRFDAEAHKYFTIFSRADGGGRQILSLGAQAAWTGPDTPIFERYYAGGFQSFRGFTYRGVSPIDTGVRVGGRWMFLGGAEYLVPLTASEMISAVAFCDVGTVEDSKVGFNNFRVTVGGGLRLTVPMMGPAPIALDWGVPILKQNFDDTRIFSFSVGISR